MAYRNKVYVAFDGDEDMSYYRMLTAWAANTHNDFELNNAHDLNKAYDSSSEESIKRQLRSRFANSKLFIILVGQHTKNLRKFVKWEIETAIRLEIPIIAVNLNGKRQADNLMPTLLLNNLSLVIPYKEVAIKHAMDLWPDADKVHRHNNEMTQFHYNDRVYEQLGI
ncbi:molecular chaperone Tir [Leuconostoc carnosum]|uniref:TIR domain-containing protein n=1 Tax=Leuconostoc carnosum TaxID=1252 RepID=UPI00123B260B|nr:TIR domain-containing protein [Leuconostoc carnosum]KAA8371118.1 molecular chaperone Tir [Leuconostoc carnosum]KAA8382759.1 molecular chaperone Tir [Leuconostoc carnosum]